MADALNVDQLDAVTAHLATRIAELQGVYLFGSLQIGAARPDSDLDLAFLARRPCDPVVVWDLGQELARMVGSDVDLVDLRRASTVMAAQVVATGERVWCGDRGQCDAFEAYTLADYARLNEERRGILDDIRLRGRVYA